MADICLNTLPSNPQNVTKVDERERANKNSSLTVIEAVRFINIKFTIHEHSGNRRKYSIKVLRMEFVK